MGVERDFFGVGVKESVVKLEDHTRGCKDSPVQRPVPNKMSTSPQSVPFKLSQDDRLKNNLCDQFSLPRFQKATRLGSIDQRSPSVFSLQKGFSVETQGSIKPFTLPVYSSAPTNLFATTVEHSNINLSSDARMFPVVSSHSIPFTQGNNFFRVHGSISSPNFSTTHLKNQYQSSERSGAPSAVVGSTNAGFAPRNSAKPLLASGQMTIFYGGEVHVYENVAVDKAQAIMLAASKGSSMNENKNLMKQAPFTPPAKMVPAVPINLNRDQVPFLPLEPVNTNCNHVSFLPPAKVVTSEPINLNRNQAQNNANSPRSSFSSPVSATSHSAHSNSGSSPTDDKSGQMNSVPFPTNQNDQLKTVNSSPPQETHAMLMTSAVRVPMARKASLARFLEKRKERVTNAEPYSCKRPNEGMADESSNVSGKAKVAQQRSMSSSGEHSWCLNTPKYSTGTEPLNTKLEI